MEVGQVSFHRDKDVRKIRVEKKINETVNRLNKTKIETFPGKSIQIFFAIRFSHGILFSLFVVDFRGERERRDAKEREDKRKILREQKEKTKEEERRRQEESELRSYSSLQQNEKMQTNYDDGNDSDDFM